MTTPHGTRDMIRLTPDTAQTGRWAWVYRLPIPQTKILLGVGLAAGTFLVAWVAMLLGREVDQGVLTILLGFCTAVLGIAAIDYHTKRNSDVDLEHVKQGTATEGHSAPAGRDENQGIEATP